MATATSVALVLLLLAAVSSSLPAADADAGFISQTCNKTKNATLCVALVSLWPGSARASTERDLAGIGLLIAADAASHRAEVISDLANSSQGMPEWGALVVCTRAYLDADKDVELGARQGFDRGDYAGASKLVSRAKGAADGCEKAIKGMARISSVSVINSLMTERCGLAGDLIDLLIRK